MHPFTPHPLLPVTGSKLTPPLPASALKKVCPTPCLGSTVERTLLVELWVSQPGCFKNRRDVLAAHLSCGSMGSGEMWVTSSPQSVPEAGEDPLLRSKERESYSHPLISCNAQESSPHTLSGHHSRTSPEGLGVGKPTLRT